MLLYCIKRAKVCTRVWAWDRGRWAEFTRHIIEQMMFRCRKGAGYSLCQVSWGNLLQWKKKSLWKGKARLSALYRRCESTLNQFRHRLRSPAARERSVIYNSTPGGARLTREPRENRALVSSLIKIQADIIHCSPEDIWTRYRHLECCSESCVSRGLHWLWLVWRLLTIW